MRLTVLAQRLTPGLSVGLAVMAASMLFGTAGAAEAQPSFAVTFGGTFDSFKPTAAGQESRQNLAGTANIEHVFAEGRGRVSYDLDAGNYDSPGDWSFFQHTAGATYRFGSGEANGRKLFLSGSAVVRSNGDAWTTSAYTAVGGGLNGELHPAAFATVRGGIRTDFRRFADLAALTQAEYRGFASLLLNLPSRTTLIGEVQAGGKQYNGTVVTIVPGTPVVTTPPAMPGGSMMGFGMGPGSRWSTRPSYTSANEQGAAGLVTVMGRIAQSLTDRTGLHGQVMMRRTFGSVPPVLVTTPAGFFEDGVYDDPFASNGLFVQAGAKHVFANAAEIAATGWWAEKDYASAVALDASGLDVTGSPLREDTVSVASVSATVPLFASKTGALGLSTDIGYRLMRHRSNDAFYNYTSHAVVVGFSIEY